MQVIAAWSISGQPLLRKVQKIEAQEQHFKGTLFTTSSFNSTFEAQTTNGLCL